MVLSSKTFLEKKKKRKKIVDHGDKKINISSTMIVFKVHLTQIDAATMALLLDAFDGDLFSFGFPISTIHTTDLSFQFIIHYFKMIFFLTFEP